MNINQIMTHTSHSFYDRISSLRFHDRKIVAVALFALGCFAACLYFFLYARQNQLTNRVTPQTDDDQPKSNPKNISDAQSEYTDEDYDEILDVAPDEQDNKINQDKIKADDKKESTSTKNQTKATSQANGKKRTASESNNSNPKPNQKKSSVVPPTPKSTRLLEDAQLKKALALSIQEMDEQELNDEQSDDHELQAVIEQSAMEVEEVDDPTLQAVMQESKKEFDENSGVSDDDLAFEETILRSAEELEAKADADLKKALDLSKMSGSVKNKQTQPKAPVSTPTTPPSPSPVTPQLKPTPKKIRLKADGTPIDDALLTTANAKSDNCGETLDLAVENAKKNKKICITSHEIKRNGVQNAYLVLNFATELKRNLAAEEMRSHYKMFQTAKPVYIGTTTLELTVEQTIEFQNNF